HLHNTTCGGLIGCPTPGRDYPRNSSGVVRCLPTICPNQPLVTSALQGSGLVAAGQLFFRESSRLARGDGIPNSIGGQYFASPATTIPLAPCTEIHMLLAVRLRFFGLIQAEEVEGS